MASTSMLRHSRSVRSLIVVAGTLLTAAFLILILSSHDSRSLSSQSHVKRQNSSAGGNEPSASASRVNKGLAPPSDVSSSPSEVPPPTSTVSSAASSPTSSESPTSATSSPISVTTSTLTSSSTSTSTSTSTSSPKVTTSTPSTPQAGPQTTRTSTPSSSGIVGQKAALSSSSVFQPGTPATTLVVDPGPSSVTSIQAAGPTNNAVAASGDGFWDNKPAVGATFGAVGLVGAGVFAVIFVAMMRKQRQRQAQARETIVWSDKLAEPYPRDGSPDPGFEELANATPMSPYNSHDPFNASTGALSHPTIPFDSMDRESYYSQNNAGYGSAAHAMHQDPYYSQPQGQPTFSGGLAPPMNHAAGSHQSQPSMDSFYGAYAHGAPGHAV